MLDPGKPCILFPPRGIPSWLVELKEPENCQSLPLQKEIQVVGDAAVFKALF